MTAAGSGSLAAAASPSPSAGSPIDRAHLARMTLGERDLEREVLALFVRQAAALAERMDGQSPDRVAAAAHTLKGSALGIGAWAVARAAEAVEQTACGDHRRLAENRETLRLRITEACAAIAELLRAH
ncbi:MAG: Hpt domain-containing protein [Pseudorhodoplanes sp.]